MGEPSTKRSSGAIGAPGGGPRFALRFEQGRGVLTLAHPLRFRFGTVEALELALGTLRFPLDLSPGPSRFRTRRTRLLAARVRIDLASIVDDRVEAPHRLVPLAPRSHGLAWALTDAFGTVAFDTLVRAEGPDLWVRIENARSASEGPMPPAARVLAAASALGLELDEVRGALRFSRVLSSVLMEALVPHGWRVPDDRAARIGVGVLDLRRIELRTLGEGESERASDSEPWERARRLAPMIAALARGEHEEAKRAREAVRERLGGAFPALAREADALLDEVREGDDALALTVALRAAVRAGRADDAVEHARALAQNEPCDAIAVEALCLASDMVAARDPGRAAALLELAAARRPRDARLALRLIEALACIPGSTGLAATIEAALGACEPGVERAELARDAAIVCELADRHDDAARLFHLAAMSLPADARVLEGLARAEARAGRNDSALGFWDRAADVLASDGEARAAARALDGAARAASALGRPDVVEERLTRATELAPHDPERWAALVRARRAIGAARPAARAEDRLLESVERAAAGAVSDLVADELAAAARAALDGGENARANSFIEALMHARGEEDARVAALRDALSRLERTIAPSTSVESLLSPSPLVERARRAALARDTAELRAALNAAERAGDLDAARSIVALALEVVGDGPARRALEETRRRLFG